MVKRCEGGYDNNFNYLGVFEDYFHILLTVFAYIYFAVFACHPSARLSYVDLSTLKYINFDFSSDF